MANCFIETLRLILRDWQESDHQPYADMNADADVMEFLPSLLSREKSVAQIKRINAHINDHGFGFFALERKDNRQFIGFTGLLHANFESYFTPCVEIGWRLNKANWGQGFATEAATACLEFGFKRLKLNEIYSFTSIHNTRSEKVMINIGMHKEGEFDHPLIEDGHSLKRHFLYNISNNSKPASRY